MTDHLSRIEQALQQSDNSGRVQIDARDVKLLMIERQTWKQYATDRILESTLTRSK